MTNKLNQAVGLVAASINTLDKLMESGFYMITLSSRQGAWNKHLRSAPNAAPGNLNYSCGTAVIVIAPDIAAVAQSYQRIADAVNKPMAHDSNIINPFDITDFDPLAEPETVWHALKSKGSNLNYRLRCNILSNRWEDFRESRVAA